jgi:cyanophycinase
LRQLFLFGSLTVHFAQNSRPFLTAAGGREARIALLFPSGAPGWERYLPVYQDPWTEAGVGQVVPILPQPDGSLDEAALDELRRATGIFMCGGDTRIYHRIYVQGEARTIIRAAYAAGVPYAGLSAGALVAPAQGMIWGDRLTTATNHLQFGGAEGKCDAELQIELGLGLIDDLLVEPHFSEEGGFPRLVAAMELTGATRGLGIDEPICAMIQDEQRLTVIGEGRAFLFQYQQRRRFDLQILEPGDGIEI